jgi:hypothetical protein
MAVHTTASGNSFKNKPPASPDGHQGGKLMAYTFVTEWLGWLTGDKIHHLLSDLNNGPDTEVDSVKETIDTFSKGHVVIGVEREVLRDDDYGIPTVAPVRRIVINRRRSVKSLAVEGRTVKQGWTCKYNGIDCVAVEVFKDGYVQLVRASDQMAIKGNPVPVRELRFITDPKAV